jgi:hypothetical protein
MSLRVSEVYSGGVRVSEDWVSRVTAPEITSGNTTLSSGATLTLTGTNLDNVTGLTYAGIDVFSDITTQNATTIEFPVPDLYTNGLKPDVAHTVEITDGSNTDSITNTLQGPSSFKAGDVSGYNALTGTDSALDSTSFTVVDGDYAIYFDPDTLTKLAITDAGVVTSDETGDITLRVLDVSDTTDGPDGTWTVERTYTIAADYPIELAAGLFTVTGGSLDVLRARSISLESESISLTGGALVVSKGLLTTLESGTYNLVGGELFTAYDRIEALEAGSISLIGGSLNLLSSLTLSLEAGSISLTGGSLTLLNDLTATLEAGTYTLSGGELSPAYDRIEALEAGSFTLTGGDVSLTVIVGEQEQLEEGTITIVGGALTIAFGPTILIQPQNISVNQPEDATFTVAVVHPQGHEMSFQWYQEGAAVPGATGSSLVVDSPASVFDGYEYYVEITDEVTGAVVQSNTVMLTVGSAILPAATLCLKRSHVSGAVPDVNDIIEGEVAINTADRKLWIRDGSNNIVLLGGLQDGWSLPTSDPVDSGKFWNDSGTLKVSDG